MDDGDNFRVVWRPTGYHLQRLVDGSDAWESIVVFEGLTEKSLRQAEAALFAEIQATRDLPIILDPGDDRETG